MLENYVDKKVKILVSSNSGAGVGTSCGIGSISSMVSSVITIFGVIKEVGDKFIEVEGARSIYLDGYQEGTNRITPTVLDNSTALVNIEHIIAIYLVG